VLCEQRCKAPNDSEFHGTSRPEIFVRTKKIIEEVRRQQHDPTLMVKSPEAICHFREALQHHRRILLERLGLYRP
jgi:hypothetical protein